MPSPWIPSSGSGPPGPPGPAGPAGPAGPSGTSGAAGTSDGVGPFSDETAFDYPASPALRTIPFPIAPATSNILTWDGSKWIAATVSSLTSGQFLVGASSMWPSKTSGCAGLTQDETATNKVNTFFMDFLTAVKTFCEVDIELPSSYNGGTMTAVFYWLANSASANSVVWGIQGRSYADAAALDQAFGVAVEVTDANTGSNQVNISTTSVVMTLAGTPAGGQHAQFRLYRLGSGADTLAATARLLGVVLTFSQN